MPSHVLDHLSLGKIVQIRERVLSAQAAGRTVYRFESGDPTAASCGVMLDALGSIDGVRPFVPRGGFYLWCELGPSLYGRLGAGDAFGESCRDAIRFAYRCSAETVRAGAPVLRALLAGGRPPAGAGVTLGARAPMRVA